MEMIRDIRDSVSDWFERNSDWLSHGVDLIKSVFSLMLTLFVAFWTLFFSVLLVVFVHLADWMSTGAEKLKAYANKKRNIDEQF